MKFHGLLSTAYLVAIALQGEFCQAGLWGSSPEESVPPVKAPESKFDYKMTIKKPYYFNDSIPFWETGGDVIKSKEFIRLTPSVPNTRGWIWSKQPNTYESWQVKVVFRVTGSQMHGGRGLALWYTKEPMGDGPIFGAKDQWDGLGIWLDSTNPKTHTPTTMAILNDGKIAFASQTDPSYHVMAACTINYRNTGNVNAHLQVQYKDNTLTVMMDPTGNGKDYRTCIKKPGLNLPVGYYFGLSASASNPADDHDIISFETWQLNPPAKIKHSKRPLEDDKISKGEEFKALDEEQKKKIEDAEFQVRQMREASEGDSVKGELTANLATVFDTQQRILENIQVMQMQIEAMGAPTPEELIKGSPESKSKSSGTQGGDLLGKASLDAAILQLQQEIQKETRGMASQMASQFDRQNKDQNRKTDEIRDGLARIERLLSSLDNRMMVHQTRLNEMTKDSAKTRGTISTFLKYISYAFGVQAVIAIALYIYWKMRVERNDKKFL